MRFSMLFAGAPLRPPTYKNIQSPFRSGIEIEDYQLDPVVRAIQMPRVNLLIADDVGLGKTIEAGMVALELIIRHRARKILDRLSVLTANSVARPDAGQVRPRLPHRRFQPDA
jgi:SNF2 family DNA or RNA helicase